MNMRHIMNLLNGISDSVENTSETNQISLMEGYSFLAEIANGLTTLKENHDSTLFHSDNIKAALHQEKVTCTACNGSGHNNGPKCSACGGTGKIPKPIKESMNEKSNSKSAKRERFIKKNKADFKERYGERWKEVLYATANKMFDGKKS